MPPGVESLQALFAGDDVQRSSLLRAGFGEHERAV
jgi:hypothetical protein